MQRQRSEYDFAHGCFLFAGLAALIISTISAIPMKDGTAGSLGFLVIIPLALALLGAIGVGIVLTVRVWDWALLMLSGMSLLFIAELATEFGSTAFYNAVPVAYGIGTIAIAGAWFLVRRGRRFP